MRLPALSGIGDEVVADATRPRAGDLGPPFFIVRGRGLHVRIALAAKLGFCFLQPGGRKCPRQLYKLVDFFI